MEVKKSAVDMFWLKLLETDQDMAIKMLSVYSKCKRIESIQVINAFTFARDKLKMHVNSASYCVDTFGDESENINLKQTPKLVYETNTTDRQS
jgi:hypothetical protein